MKKLLTILLFSLLSVTTYSQQPDLALRPIKENIWIEEVNITEDDTFCNYTNLPIGQYDLLLVPTAVMNLGNAPAYVGRRGDGFIEPYKCNAADVINGFQQIKILDYCTRDSVAGKPKNIFALQQNMRPYYVATGSGRVVRYSNSVINSLLEEHPIPDSLRLASAPITDDTTNTGFIIISVGAGDIYYCYDGNGVDMTNLEPGFYIVQLILTPTPFLSAVEANYWSNTYEFVIYYEEDSSENYFVKWGDNLPPLPICPPTCDISNPDPDNIKVDTYTHIVSWDSTGACDFNELKRQIICEKRNMPDQQFDDAIFNITTETQIFDRHAMTDRNLQRYAKANYPNAYNGGKFVYRYRIGNTVSQKVNF